MSAPLCRLCGAELSRTFVDLGMSPPCESYLSADQLDQGETFYPLNVRICESCLLVQLPAYIAAEDIFSHYAYFSSFSESWVEHARRYVEDAATRLRLDQDSFVVEVASNDGYLLQHVAARGIRCHGIEPAANVAEAARAKGIPTTVTFLGVTTGREFAAPPGDAGTVSIEIPHLLRLIEGNLYDTIYHEHYSYLSLLTTQRVLEAAGLTVVDVEELSTHGGSLRTWSVPTEAAGAPSDSVAKILADEEAAGLHSVEGHDGFARSVATARNDLVQFLLDRSREGATVAAYGAPGKGNTLLNHAGVRQDLISFTVDRNTFKHGKFLPGTHIPIFDPSHLDEARPDYIVVLPWNLREEITQQLAHTREWGARLVFPLPTLEVLG
jgi:hypothetical protein